MNRPRASLAFLLVSALSGCAYETSDLFGAPPPAQTALPAVSPEETTRPDAFVHVPIPVPSHEPATGKPVHLPLPLPELTRCSARAPFVRVAPVAGIPTAGLGSATLSANEREIFFTQVTPPATANAVVRMTRGTTAEPFSTATSTVVAKEGFHRGIALSPDGTTLLTIVRVAGMPFAGMAVHVARRASPAADFGALEPTPFAAAHPFSITQMSFKNGDDFFASVALGGAWRIKNLTLTAPIFDAAMTENQAALDPNSMASGAVGTRDGRFAYVGVGLPDWPTTGILFGTGLAERAAGATKLSVPTPIGAPLDTAAHGSEPQWLSTDECRLYYVELTETGRRLMVATK